MAVEPALNRREASFAFNGYSLDYREEQTTRGRVGRPGNGSVSCRTERENSTHGAPFVATRRHRNPGVGFVRRRDHLASLPR